MDRECEGTESTTITPAGTGGSDLACPHGPRKQAQLHQGIPGGTEFELAKQASQPFLALVEVRIVAKLR